MVTNSRRRREAVTYATAKANGRTMRNKYLTAIKLTRMLSLQRHRMRAHTHTLLAYGKLAPRSRTSTLICSSRIATESRSVVDPIRGKPGYKNTARPSDPDGSVADSQAGRAVGTHSQRVASLRGPRVRRKLGDLLRESRGKGGAAFPCPPDRRVHPVCCTFASTEK